MQSIQYYQNRPVQTYSHNVDLYRLFVRRDTVLEHTFTMTDPENVAVHVYKWLPENQSAPLPVRGIVQITHGMSETAKRYKRLAESLTAQGFIVYAHDQRGHGLTASGPESLGDPGDNGFYWMTQNVIQLSKSIRDHHPTLPLFIMGHSMGSFIIQKVMYEQPDLYDGFMLSGTNGKRNLLRVGKQIAHFQQRLRGQVHRSLLLNMIVFASYNKGLPRPRKTFDWLSRDPEEVSLFMNDPFCGKLPSVRFYVHFFELLLEIHRPEHMKRISPDKPVYLFSGERDPVGQYGKGVKQLYQQYLQLGLQDVKLDLYPDSRHETLNDINRDEVTANVIHWLDEHLSTTAIASK